MNRIKLNAIQYKFWMDHQLKYPSNEYNDTNYTFRVKGNLSVEILQAAYRSIMMEYPLLYSLIQVEDTIPYFRFVGDKYGLPFEYKEIAPCPDSEIKRLVKELVARPFNLDIELPCRFYVLYDGSQYFLVHIIHHVVMDGISLPLFFDRLSQIYSSLLDNTYYPLSQYAGLQSFSSNFDTVHEKTKKNAMDYWVQYIQDVPIQLSIPHIPDKICEDEAYYFQLGNNMFRRIQTFCRQQHTSPFRLYASVWALTLSRVARIDKLLLDHTLNLRPEQDGMLLGVFVNNLPLRFDFSNDSMPFFQVLQTVAEDRRTEIQHQHVFYHDFLSSVSSREVQHGGVNVMINYPARWNQINMNLEGCMSVPFVHSEVSLSADLALLVEDNGQLDCTIRHQSHFSSGFVRSLSVIFGQILQQVVANVDVLLKDIHLLPSSYQDSLMEGENKNIALSAPAESFLPRFQHIVETQGHRIAVKYGGQMLTYAQLDALSNRVAACICSRGWQKRRLALSTPKHIDQIVGIWGILKSGNTYVPLDYQLPEERIRFMVDDCNIAAILVTGSTPSMASDIPVLCIEEILQTEHHDDAPVVEVSATDDAYIIYTSGTTGRPKAIPIQHSMLNQMVENHLSIQQLDTCSRVAQFSNISFDASIFEIFPVLNAGGTLVLPDEALRKDTALYYEFLKEESITVAYIPPAFLTLLPHEDLPLLHTIMVGGDTTPVQTIKKWSKGRRLLNCYGPTENTVDTTYTSLLPDSPYNDIGPAEPGVSCYVVDACGHLVPDNTLGELWIGGVKLTEGYINRPELNAEKFVPNPFVSDDDRKRGRNTIVYKTGDLVMRRPDGHLLFMGREDFQVKLHGYRIELGDIETQIMNYGHGVRNAMVVMNQKEQLRQLVAYVVVDVPDELDADNLRKDLHRHLPAYMVPAVIIPLNEFPYNASGKVDRRRLPDPSHYQAAERKIQLPVTPAEKQLAGLWQQLLPGQTVGRDDDFTALGGDSLAVIQLSFNIEETFGVSVRASEIYQYSTLSRLAAFIDSHAPSAHAIDAGSGAMGSDTRVPLSPTQMSLWLQCVQSDQMSGFYNVPCLFKCPQHTPIPELIDVLNRIVSLQDSFRMSFPLGPDHKPYIHISDYVPFSIEHKHLTDHQLGPCFNQDMQVRFNLETGPLFSIHIYTVGQSDIYCSLVMHHLISDGWSVTLIQRLVQQSLSGESVDWSRFKGSYLPYARQCHRMAQTETGSRRHTYWDNQLSHISDIPLFERKQGSVTDIKGQMSLFTLPSQSIKDINAFVGENNYTLFEVCCAAYLLLLARWSGQTGFAVGFPYLGREQSQYQQVVGFFVHILPLCYKKEYNDLTFLEYVGAIHQQLVDAETHSLSYDQLTQIARSHTDSRNFQLIQTIFTMGTNELFYQYLPAGYVSFPLVMTLLTDTDSITCRIEYQEACLTADEVNGLFAAYSTLLANAVAHPHRNVTACSLTSSAFRQAVVQDNECSSHLAESTPLFLDSFTAMSQQYPDKEALVCGDRSMTYSELDRQSSDIAARIKASDIALPACIAVNMVGSIHSLTAILGILKAGCCYVPVDVALPDERRTLIFNDAHCAMYFDEEHYPEATILTVGKNPANLTGVAYIIYTSGTTGVPKGVPVRHQALAHLLHVLPPISEMSAASRVLLFSSISFDASITQIFTTLSCGATLVIATPSERRDPSLLAALIARQHISYIEIPAAILPLLPQHEFPLLHTIVVGGESCSSTVLQSWAEGRKVINAYGPTENTVDTTLCVVDKDFEPNDIGQHLPGVSCYVLDEYKNIVPPNQSGELYIGGCQLTQGYLNRPELNRTRFIPNPYVSAADAARGINTVLYKSGDIVRRRPDGHLIFVGRSDRQVKLRGYRIELSEIENQLLQCADVQRAVVEIQKENQTEELVAYIQSETGARPEQLQSVLRSRMPEYMVPVKWTVVSKFPLTVNGKTDWRRMPKPELVMRDPIVQPATPDEELMLQHLRQIMSTDTIGVETDLIDAGITSLQIMELVVALSPQLRITISSVYEYRTIRLLLQKGHSRDCFWANDYREDRPVMILLCGFNDFHPFHDKLVEYFKDKYSIFVLDSFVDFLVSQQQPGLDALLDYYVHLVQTELQGKTVYALMGHCLGSEIAMHLATRLKQLHMAEPKVLVFGGTFTRRASCSLLEPTDDENLIKRRKAVSQLIDSLPVIHYDGEVIIGLAHRASRRLSYSSDKEVDDTTFQNIKSSMQQNLLQWQTAYPHAPLLDLDADHWSFFEQRPLDQVWTAIRKYWKQ